MTDCFQHTSNWVRGRVFLSVRIRASLRFKRILCFVLIDVRYFRIPLGVRLTQVEDHWVRRLLLFCCCELLLWEFNKCGRRQFENQEEWISAFESRYQATDSECCSRLISPNMFWRGFWMCRTVAAYPDCCYELYKFSNSSY
jgi:hypothetical protein